MNDHVDDNSYEVVVRRVVPSLQTARAVAAACRSALEEASGPGSDVAFQSFPRGACGDVSDLLARFLLEHRAYEARVAVGTKDGHESHAWVVLGSMIIDITADQFDGQQPVIVTYDSPWHEAWSPAIRPHIGPDDWPAYPDRIWKALVALDDPEHGRLDFFR